ncbi:MAG: hypothetical protein EAY65_05345 [Alphaproteobacteria bacterium]|nr:MAG: hypothetical protein EAY65_05345 [Alphaproteobacteria bacterium]
MKKIIIALSIIYAHIAYASHAFDLPKSCVHYRGVIPTYWGEGLSFDGDSPDKPTFGGSCSDDTISLGLGFGKGCTGGNACRIGGYLRQRLPSSSLVIYPREIFMPVYFGGDEDLIGYFIPATCGANCSDSHLMWIEEGYFYEISMKAADKDELVKARESMK